MKTDFSLRLGVSRNELSDGIKDDAKVLIVFLFEFFNFLGEEFVGIHQSAELHEGARDRNVHFHCTGGA